MRQFVAILKDSFREAVDGSVIYVMLALSAVVVLVVGSLSFAPAPPEKAFAGVVRSFSMVFPDRGQSRVPTFSPVEYAAADVRPAGSGYALRLTARGQGRATGIAPDGGEKAAGGDSFREAVAGWARPAERSRQVEARGKKIEVGERTAVTDADQRAVTDAEMEAFLRNQFAVHAGMDAVVTRVAAAEPEYAFDVTTAGGAAVRGWPHTVKIFFGAVTVSEAGAPLGMVLWLIEDQIINGLGGAVTLLVGIIITAFFIPNMLRKGSVDLLISKPIGRAQLLVYKYVGGLTFVFLVTAVTVGGVWLALAARSGYWDPAFLVVIPVLTFTFAILYAVSTAAAVFTGSPVVAMLLSVGTAVFLFLVGKAKQWMEGRGTEGGDTSGWAYTLVDTLNNVLPRYKDLDTLTSKLIASGTLTRGEERMTGLAALSYPSWPATLGVSLAFIAVLLALSCWRFSRRDN